MGPWVGRSFALTQEPDMLAHINSLGLTTRIISLAILTIVMVVAINYVLFIRVR
jgi:hypothetical protein